MRRGPSRTSSSIAATTATGTHVTSCTVERPRLSDAIPVLGRIVVAPMTRMVRRIPTEIRFGPDDGLPAECAASFDDLHSISRRLLTARLAAPDTQRRREICAALAALGDC